MKNILLIMAIMVVILNACKPDENIPIMNEPVNSSTSVTPHLDKPILVPTLTPASVPTSADSNLLRGNIYLDSMELLTMESSPLQFTLALKGNLPTPCDQLQVKINQPDAEKKIVVDVYSATQADNICAQVLQPFEENLPLGSFPAGHYTLWVNGEQVADFDA